MSSSSSSAVPSQTTSGWSKKPQNHLALMQLAAGLIAFKKAHTAALQG
jgi:hypothetical protein